MTRPELDFSNGNNSALSLRILAEMCRTGEAKVIAPEQAGPNDVIVVLHYTSVEPTLRG